MGGLVIDIWILFLVRTLAVSVRRIRSRKWPKVRATVFQSFVEPGGGFGCAVTTVSYYYLVGEESHSGTHDEPSLSHSAADWVARLYSKGKEITIRYHPHDPSHSVALI